MAVRQDLTESDAALVDQYIALVRDAYQQIGVYGLVVAGSNQVIDDETTEYLEQIADYLQVLATRLESKVDPSVHTDGWVNIPRVLNNQG
jgi:hypothetical protein